MARNPDQHRLSEAEHQAIFEQDIKPDLFTSAKSVDAPVAIIFGGQPGAGKSAAIDAAKDELAKRGGAVEIVGDDLRSYHPKYNSLMREDDKTAAFYTDRDSGRWVEKAIEEAKARRVNIVIEGTMRDGDKVAATMETLRAAGYTVDARALAVNPRLSEQGILQRYELQKATRGFGRMTAPEAHQAAYEGMLGTLERIEGDKLADRVTIFRRRGEAIYTNELRDGQWTHAAGAREAVEAERARPMSLEERRAYVEGYERLAAMATKPGRNATAEEVERIARLRQQARRELMAEVFRQEPPEKAVAEFPELAPAYMVMKASEPVAARKLTADEWRQRFTTLVKETLAERIEQGRPLEVKKPERESVAQLRDRGKTPGRDR